MATLILGSQTSVEAYRETVSEYDPNLSSLWSAALAAGQVDGSDNPTTATQAARLSAVTRFRPLDGNRECYVSTGFDPLAALKEICDAGGVIDHHFAAGTGPVWVEGDDAGLVALIAQKYGCPVGRPAGWDSDEYDPIDNPTVGA